MTAHFHGLRVGAGRQLVQYGNLHVDARPLSQAQSGKARIGKGRRLGHVPYGGVQRFAPDNIAYAATQSAADVQRNKGPKLAVQHAARGKLRGWRLRNIGNIFSQQPRFNGGAGLL